MGSIPAVAVRTRDVTSDVIWRQNFPPIRLTSETATAKKEDQWKGYKIVGGTAKKVWGAQVRDANTTAKFVRDILMFYGNGKPNYYLFTDNQAAEHIATQPKGSGDTRKHQRHPN